MSKITYYDICGLEVALIGEGKDAEELRKYFLREYVAEPIKVDISVCFVDTPLEVEYIPQYSALQKKITFGDGMYSVNGKSYTYWVNNLFDKEKVTEVTIFNKTKHNIRNEILDSLRANPRFIFEITSYDTLWYIFAITLMKKEKVFIHSGIASASGKATVLCGTGGCGKTSAMLELVDKYYYKYMSEDFGVIGAGGRAYQFPKKGSVYLSDYMHGNSRLQNAFGNMPFRKKVIWKLKCVLNGDPCHQFSPEELFGNDIEKESTISKAVFLERSMQSEDCVMQSVSTEEFAVRAMHASFRELKFLYELLNNILAVSGEKAGYPTISTLENDYIRIVKKALSNVECFVLTIPLKCEPSRFVEQILLRNKE